MPKFVEVKTDDWLATTKDAARYRWLRDIGADTVILKKEASFYSDGQLIHVKQIGWTELDKAIDSSLDMNNGEGKK